VIGLLLLAVGSTPLCCEFTEGRARPDLIVGPREEKQWACDLLDFDASRVAILPVGYRFGIDHSGGEHALPAGLECGVIAERVGEFFSLDLPWRES